MDRQAAPPSRAPRPAHRWSPLRRSEWLVRGVVVFCLLYAVLAQQTRTEEKVPFFGWSLFSEVPQPRETNYSVRLLELDGKRFDPPVYFEEAHLVDQARLVQSTRAMQGFGRAAEGTDAATAAFHAQRFKDVYLTKYQTGRYEVVKRTFDIRDRFECECFIEEEVVGEYSFG